MLKSSREPLLLVLPALLVLILFFFIPIGRLIVNSFYVSVEAGGTAIGLGNYTRFFADDYYIRVLWRTFRLALIQTLFCVILGFPLAYIMTRLPPRWRIWLLALIVLPLMTSVVIRTFGWVVILGRGGILTQTLYSLGLVKRNFQVLYTEVGIIIAMVQVLLPFLVMSLLGVMLRIDPKLEEAARTMGSDFFTTIWTVVFPLSIPGIVSGSLLVFTLSISSFITPTLIGGPRLPVLAGSIFESATSTLNWEFAAAQSMLLLLAVLIVIVPYIQVLRQMEHN